MITGMSIHAAIQDRNNQILSATHQALGAPQGDSGMARVTASASTDELRPEQDVLPEAAS
jgi:hypothetical protein